MSLKIAPQPDGSIVISCGADQVTIPAAAPVQADASDPIEPIFPNPGTVVARWGPPPDDAISVGEGDLSALVSRLDPDLDSLSLKVPVSRSDGVDIEALLALTRKQLAHEVPINLYFRLTDD